MKGDIDKLIQFITKHFPFDESVYTELKDASKEERLRFAVRHSAIHFSKTAGKIAAISEKADHEGKVNPEDLKLDTVKGLVNALRLAELISLSEAEIIHTIEEMYKDKINLVK